MVLVGGVDADGSSRKVRSVRYEEEDGLVRSHHSIIMSESLRQAVYQ